MKNVLFVFIGILLAFLAYFMMLNDWNVDTLTTKPQQDTIQTVPSKDDTSTLTVPQKTQETTTVAIKDNTKATDVNTDSESIYKEEMQEKTVKTIEAFKTKSLQPFILDMTNAQEVKMKIKAREKDGIVKAKISISHDMLTYDQAKKKGLEANFITHIQGFVGERIVYDVSSSQFLSKNPLIKFSFAGKKGEELKIIYKQLKGEVFYSSRKIK